MYVNYIMKIFKCIIYSILIALLIIIAFKSINMLKENFENTIDDVSDKKTTFPNNIINSLSISTKNIIDKVKNNDIISSIINKNNTVETPIINDNNMDSLPLYNNLLNENNEIITHNEKKQENIQILPKFIDKVSNTIFDGVKFIPQQTLSPWASAYMNNNDESSFMINLGGDDPEDLDQGSGRFAKKNMACCSEQYPLPFKLKLDNDIAVDKNLYVPNPYMGNDSWSNSGCLCMKKSNMIKLATRGGNA